MEAAAAAAAAELRGETEETGEGTYILEHRWIAGWSDGRGRKWERRWVGWKRDGGGVAVGLFESDSVCSQVLEEKLSKARASRRRRRQDPKEDPSSRPGTDGRKVSQP